MHSRLLLMLVVCGCPVIAIGGEDETPLTAPPAGHYEFFEKRIRPLLAERCYGCHSARAESLKGGLRLDAREFLLAGGDSGPAVILGRPSESELVRAVRYDPDGLQMPPDGMLDERQIADLTQWVQWGAPWPDAAAGLPPERPPSADGIAPGTAHRHWAFEPIVAHRPPPVHDRSWPRSPIDHFILERLELAGLQPAPEADRETWLRRASFSLLGLPPSVELLDSLRRKAVPADREQVISSLLASPRYGERWARHWLDLVRFAETAGNEFDYEIPFAWKYRDYVIRAFNEDVPYDQFVTEHIAGDLIPGPRWNVLSGVNESVLGTGFFWLGQALQSPIDVLEEQYDTIENQIDVLSKTFLGLTVACARCHDHKFDPIPTRDYYSLVGFLRSSRRQYAFIDAPDRTLTTISRLRAIDAEHRDLVFERALRRLESVVSRVEPALLGASRTLDDPLTSYLRTRADRNPLDILYPWSVLASADSNSEFRRRRDSLWSERVGTVGAKPTAGRDLPFEEFSSGFEQRWTASGPAFRPEAQVGAEFFLDASRNSPLRRIVASGSIAYSGAASGRLQGALRSETFTIRHKFIDYFMYRTDQSPSIEKLDPGDLKEGQVHLIIDGFHLIREPIYDGLSIDVAEDLRPRWYRQDVSKWVGHRAYIEIRDEDNGFLVIDRIDCRDGPPPLNEPNQLLAAIAKSATSLENFAAAFAGLLHETLETARSRFTADFAVDRDRLELLNWLLERGEELFATGEAQLLDTPGDDGARWFAYLAERQRLEDELSVPQRALATIDGTGEDSHVLVRGDHRRPGALARRTFLSVLAREDKAFAEVEGSGRRQLADRITDDSNPLLARVIANRIWQHHFGRGIVPTPDDFGLMGQPPTHPELLDYLATELIRSGWSLKHLQRLIVTSSTFAMSSEIRDAASAVDPANRLLHRMPVRRLEGEAIRDAVLAVSGRLDQQMFGPGVLPHLTPFMEGRGRPETSGPLDGDGRRSVYLNVRRNFLTPMFLVFDYPLPLSTTGQRSASNVPAQALTMWNNPFVIEQARQWAERLLGEDRDDSDVNRIRRLYKMSLARDPDPRELEAARQFVGERLHQVPQPRDAWADLCHVLLNAKEFIYIR